MADLDGRLLGLIEILREAGASWLAQEVIDGALVGDVPMEQREALLQQPKNATSEGAYVWQRPPGADLFAGQPYTGDQQVEWAVDHVIRRLDEAVAMMGSSLTRIDSIINPDPDSREHLMRTELVLRDQDFEAKTNVKNLADATNAIGHLREALHQWASSVLAAGGRS